ncbi:MAG TPA: c-type cytochrome [Pyrinomonadaceae bacterium]|nr:c-type cytochrome [Pyrinomonadaceae bacterium]
MRRIAQLALAVVAGFFILVWAGASHTVSSAGQNSDSSQAASGAALLYKDNCAKCHGKDGRAKGFKAKLGGVRNLTDAKWHESVTDERIFNSITSGRNRMPAFGKKLADAEIESLVAFVRSLRK